MKKNSLRFHCAGDLTAIAVITQRAVTGILLLLCAVSVSADNVFTLGIVPQYKAKKIHQAWQPLIDEIQIRTGIQLEILSKPSISEFEVALKSGEFDFAYINPYHMLIANNSQGYQPLVRDIGRSLQGVLVVSAKSEITDIKELDNQRIAFPSANALGASLLIRQELDDDFDIIINPVFVKTHDSVYLNVVLNQTAAGGGVEKTLDKQNKKVRDKLRVLYRTGKVASHPIAVHPRVPESISNKILDALLSLGEDDTGRKLLARIPIEKIGKASLSDYTPLVEKRLKRYTTEIE